MATGTTPTEKETTSQPSAATSNTVKEDADATAPYANGYHFPPHHSFGVSTKNGLKAFWDYFTTPLGFIVVIYGLNIVAWGGMLFLLLVNAGKLACLHLCSIVLGRN